MGSSRFQILENHPSAIFERGLQDDFLITNTGITSVYLDSDSSINTNSLRLRPLASIVWSGHKPLWALAGKPPSYRGATYLDNVESIAAAQITVTYNSDNVNTATTSYVQPIADIPAFAGSGSSVIRFDNVEVGHLEAVVLRFQAPDLAWDPANILLFDLYWLDEASDSTATFRPILHQRLLSYYPNPAYTSYGGLNLTIPVRGPRLAIQVTSGLGPTNPPPNISDVKLYGRSGKSKLLVTGIFDSNPVFSSGIAAGFPFGDDHQVYTPINGYDGSAIYWMPRSSLLRITMRNHAAVTAAGKLVLLVNGAWYDDFDIPVSPINSLLVKDFQVPLTGYMQLAQTTAPTPAPTGLNYTLSFTFKDGATL